MMDAKAHLLSIFEADPRRSFTFAELRRASELPEDALMGATSELIREGRLARSGDRLLLNRRRRGLPPAELPHGVDRRAG